MRSPLPGSLSTALVVAIAIGAAHHGVAGDQASQLTQLQQKLSPSPGDVLASLDEYDHLWIEVKHNRHGSGSCVWSECGIDDTDDAYMGDNRDGDEKWYQYRTQGFCANAAYVLYGKKRDWLDWLDWDRCTEGNYINSFFTYGGADNLMKAVGKNPPVYYEGYTSYSGRRLDEAANEDGAGNDDAMAANDDQANNNGYDDQYSSYSQPHNADCVPIYDYYDEDQENANAYDNERERHLSGSEDGNDAGYSSTLGCTSKGQYAIGLFKSSSCDGNYFLKQTDAFKQYNRQYSRVGCHSVWSRHNSASNEVIQELLSNSWACDIRLYPHSCPDPYGEKGHYEYALRTAANGGDPLWAYRHMVWKKPLRLFTWFLALLTALAFGSAYLLKNTGRIKAQGGGWRGAFACAKEDVASGCERSKAAMVDARAKAMARMRARREKQERKKSPRKSPSKRRKSRSSRRGEEGEDGGDVEMSRSPRKSKKSPRKSKSKSRSRRERSRGEGGDEDPSTFTAPSITTEQGEGGPSYEDGVMA